MSLSLDDYADAALSLADWAQVAGQAKIQVFTRHLSENELIAALQPFEIVCTLRERSRLSRETLARLPNLKVIIVNRCARGHDRQRSGDPSWHPGLRRKSARRHAIRAHLYSGICLGPHACHCASHSRGVATLSRRRLATHPRLCPGRAHLGYHRPRKIGMRMAHYARAFDMQVLAWSENLTDDAADKAGAKRVEKGVLFRNSDIVTVHYVLSARSRGLVGKPEIAAMKPTAYLINTVTRSPG